MSTAVYSQELNSCLVCKKQPVPQSRQNIYLSTLSIAMVFLFNLKLALLFFMVSYYFSEIVWKCPVCKRQIDVVGVNQEVEEHVIVRMGNCLVMFSKRKCGIATLLVLLLVIATWGYGWYEKANRPLPDKVVTADWEAMAKDTGKNAMMDNQIHAKHLFEKYAMISEWRLEGIYLGEGEMFQTITGERLHTLKIKMNPTQNKNPDTPDIVIYPTTQHEKDLKKGDIVSFVGDMADVTPNWYLFRSWSLKKTDRTGNPEDSKLFDWLSGHLRNHQ